MVNFLNDEWKEKLKGKSPEEIAKIVGEYYEKKYRREYAVFPWKVLLAIIIFFTILILILLLFLRYLKNLAPY